FFHTSDDHKDAFAAQVGVFDNGERIGTLYPAKWDFHKDEPQVTTEVAIRVRPLEDVYVVLTGYDMTNEHAVKANFRVYINPVILWVWIGFLILALGTLVCLIPQFVVDLVQGRPQTPLGRAADGAILLAIVVGIGVGLANQAHAAPPAGAEHPATA